MRHIFAAIMLYFAFVAHVGIRFGVTGSWTPNLMMLAVLFAAPRSTRIAFAALAGLLFDATSGRPLGVTMLVATLVVTILRNVRRADDRAVSLTFRSLEVFLAVFAVEAASRLLAGTVVASFDRSIELTTSLKIAASTMMLAVLLHVLRAAVKSLWRIANEGPHRPSALFPPSMSPSRR